MVNVMGTGVLYRTRMMDRRNDALFGSDDVPRAIDGMVMIRPMTE
jgi:hypothetical protein